jgi:hypothetical protein
MKKATRRNVLWPFYIQDLLRSSRISKNIDPLSGLSDTLKFHPPFNQGKQRIIAAFADVHAGIDPRTALAHQDAAGSNELSVKTLDAKKLRIAVTAIACAASALFVCHFFWSPNIKEVG